ncbi:MAG TPA: hypothetical protein ENJ56_02600 [Anaerolineae bacterium]|nr:hypothetical protein [Anaerolineae bacterium]
MLSVVMQDQSDTLARYLDEIQNSSNNNQSDGLNPLTPNLQKLADLALFLQTATNKSAPSAETKTRIRAKIFQSLD